MKIKLTISLMLAALTLSVLQPAAAVDGVELVPSQRVIMKITEDMTIDQIIEGIYPRNRDLWPQIKEKLIETNPASFEQYSDRLIPGKRLKLVDVKRTYDQQELPPRARVGFVSRLEGQARSTDDAGRVATLQDNSLIFEGDRIETDPESRIRILLDDGAEVQLKGDTVLKITEYVITSGYEGGSSSVLDLLRGGLRKITGAIGASATANYRVRTGMASIGIRGTEYVIKLCRLDDCTQTVSRDDPDARLHAAVLEGAITLTTDDEVRILLAQGEYGTATTDSVQIEGAASLPAGFLDRDEVRRFESSNQQRAENIEQDSSGAWKWVLGILLLAAGL